MFKFKIGCIFILAKLRYRNGHIERRTKKPEHGKNPQQGYKARSLFKKRAPQSRIQIQKKRQAVFGNAGHFSSALQRRYFYTRMLLARTQELPAFQAAKNKC